MTAFLPVCLYELRDFTQAEFEEMLRFANAASIVTTRKGALAVMPGR